MNCYMEGAVIMGKDTIITIGRQCGSGGHDIGIALSKRLNIPYYDKEQQRKVGYVKRSLRNLMRNQPVAYYTPLLWIHIP